MNKTAMVIEMAQDLVAMNQDMYMTCKYILLITSMKHKNVHDLVIALIGFSDCHRQLLIETKKGGAI